MLNNKSKLPIILFWLYIFLFIWLAFNPYNRHDWWAENITVLVIVAYLTWLYYKNIRFSNAAYIFMCFWVYLHTIGGHFTFERVPLGPLYPLFEIFTPDRNNFDRVAHFTVGFYAFPIAEYLYEKKLVANKIMLFLFPVFFIGFLAMFYELVEWFFSITTPPELASDYLGSQGDIWDAQKDMLADTLGGIFASTTFIFSRTKR